MKPVRIRSLRSYIQKLDELGDIQEIDQEVDWDLELSAVIRRSYDLMAPAPLFTNVKGCPGFRVLGAPASLSSRTDLRMARIALSLGLSPATPATDLVEALANGHRRTPVSPTVVNESACKEVVLLNDQVDLTRLPAPMIHEGDGGRYINTWGVIISQNPRGSWTNWSIARIMLLDKRRILIGTGAAQHVSNLYNEWLKCGEPMPFALALGVEPAIPFVGGMPLPSEVSEADFLGGYFGESIEVIRCETNSLKVPASAEIVLEGTISHMESAKEGPMGEYAGYLWLNQTREQPIVTINAVTHRNNAILPVVAAGPPVEEDHTCWGLGIAAQLLHELRCAGFPVKRCFSPFESAIHWLVVTVDDQFKSRAESNNLVRSLRDFLTQSRPFMYLPKFFLIDDQIDPSDARELIWAIATRLHPTQSATFIENVPIMKHTGSISPEERLLGYGTKVIYNCLGPFPAGNFIPKATTFRSGWPLDIQERVLSKWHEYGYD
jgi:UbiD family decarboxylase